MAVKTRNRSAQLILSPTDRKVVTLLLDRNPVPQPPPNLHASEIPYHGDRPGEFIARDESYSPIFAGIVDHLNTTDVWNLAHTCAAYSGAFKKVLKMRFNIDKELHSFVENPKLFRAELGRHDGIIFGEAALLFFDRKPWGSKLSIFIEYEMLDEFATYLENEEGYTEENLPDNEAQLAQLEALLPTHPGDRGNLHQLVRPETEGRGEKTILLVGTSVTPILAVFLLPTTAAQTFITWNAAYCVWPRPTCLQRKSYLKEDLRAFSSVQVQTMLRWYSSHGWYNLDVEAGASSTCNRSFKGIRRPGDARTWRIEFPLDGVTPPAKPAYILETASFTIEPTDTFHTYFPRPNLITPPHYVLTSTYFRMPNLRWTWVYPDGISVWYEVQQRLFAALALALYEVPEAQRPAGWDGFLTGFQALRPGQAAAMDPGYTLPDNWTFMDPLVPGMIKELEDAVAKGEIKPDAPCFQDF
jgi:hypothetical protein